MGLRRKALILAKEESTYGTDPTPTAAANALLAFNPTLNPVGAKVTREPVRDTISPSPGLVGGRYYELSFETELYASGTAGTAPRYGDLLEACSMTETVVASTSVTYKPNSLGTTAKSVTIYAYFDGRLHQLQGCVGTFELVAAMGQPARLRWTFRGLYEVPTDVSVPSPTLESGINAPPKVLGVNLTFNSLTTFIAQQVTLDLGNQIANRVDVNATHGYKGFVVASRQGRGSWNPEAFTVAAYDVWTDWINATLRQLSLAIGSGAGNICTITCPKLEIDDVRQGDREGVETFEMPFSMAYNTGDDEIQLVYT